MSKNFPSPLELIRRHNLNLKKSLGQNLLIDTTHLARIAAAAELTKEDTVLEIGPGLGALTHQLAERAGRVVAVELDQRTDSSPFVASSRPTPRFLCSRRHPWN